MTKRVTILGATGSIGRSTLDVIRKHPDHFEVVALVAGRDGATLAEIAKETRATFVAIADPAGFAALKRGLLGTGIACGSGPSAILEAVDYETDLVVAAIAGTAGLKPTHAAMKPGRTVALANKECLVCAGESFMRDAAAKGVTVLPIDSEHNALAQALGTNTLSHVERMILTASGGPFRTWDADAIACATPEQALAHPTWSMGSKVTIDSASLMNKGLELIEAYHLFGLRADEFDVLVHPQSIVHGLVSFKDGSMTAGLAMPDMRVPIAWCLGHPERLDPKTKRLDLASIQTLTFEAPDLVRFPALKLAFEALNGGGALPTLLNAANEIAVEAFLNRRLSFGAMAHLIEETIVRLCGRYASAPQSVDEALEINHEARLQAESLLPKRALAAT